MGSRFTPDDVRVAAERIIAAGGRVSVVDAGVQKAAAHIGQSIERGTFSLANWSSHPLCPKDDSEASLNWVFVVDTLNFSFWTTEGDPSHGYSVRFGGEEYTGYWSLCAAINRALEEGIPVTTAEFYASMTKAQLEHIFRSSSGVPVPLLDDRLANLHEAGRVLLDKYDGKFCNLLDACGKSAKRLVELVTQDFSSYRDVTEYHGEAAPMLKRAQILVADVWGCTQGHGCGDFGDIGCLTMFADYRVPQALLYFGALEYRADLLATLEEGILLANGDEREVEIRAGSILAVERIRTVLESQLGLADVNSVMIDFYLWDYAKANEDAMAHLPIHHTRSIYY